MIYYKCKRTTYEAHNTLNIAAGNGQSIAYLYVYRPCATALYKNIAHLYVPRSLRGFVLREDVYMEIVKVKQSYYDWLRANRLDSEILINKEGRPCVLVVRLKYRGENQDFVVPIRSNISPTAPYSQYLSLPPNSQTRPRHHHGVHYIKLFPVDASKHIDKFHYTPDDHFAKAAGVIACHEREIVDCCQKYLLECENGKKNIYTPDIDGIIRMLRS